MAAPYGNKNAYIPKREGVRLDIFFGHKTTQALKEVYRKMKNLPDWYNPSVPELQTWLRVEAKEFVSGMVETVKRLNGVQE